jgi:elongation factor 1-gamma
MPSKIYYNHGNPRGNKVLVAAQLANIEIDFISLSPEQWKSEEHLRRYNDSPLSRHPLGKAPVLETEAGFIFESNAILRHVARLSPSTGLYGYCL